MGEEEIGEYKVLDAVGDTGQRYRIKTQDKEESY